jgi:hypothetical protein
VRRGFWIALGLGAGAAGAVLVGRLARRTAERLAPRSIAREAGGSLVELSKLVAASLEEGRRAMQERERELRAELEAERGPGNDRSSAARG